MAFGKEEAISCSLLSPGQLLASQHYFLLAPWPPSFGLLENMGKWQTTLDVGTAEAGHRYFQPQGLCTCYSLCLRCPFSCSSYSQLLVIHPQLSVHFSETSLDLPIPVYHPTLVMGSVIRGHPSAQLTPANSPVDTLGQPISSCGLCSDQPHAQVSLDPFMTL